MEKKIAEERIKRLFEIADKRARNAEKYLADRYMKLARKIGMSYNVPLPSNLKKKVCSNCDSYLIPGRNCSVRINSKKDNISYKCKECGEVSRYGF